MSVEVAVERELVECGQCEAPHAFGACPPVPPRTEKDMIERLEARLASAEERLDRLEGDRDPIDERELGEAALG